MAIDLKDAYLPLYGEKSKIKFVAEKKNIRFAPRI